jgi:putative nucleotidyltransferase with HDIG domain
MDTYGMLHHIRNHSIIVTGAARIIGQGLRFAGIPVSVKLITAAALMHDIGKTVSLQSGQDHTEVGRQICLENDMAEIADLVAQHVRLAHFRLNGRYSETEVVYYADKRVNHDCIVSLGDRLDYILQRYGQNRDGLRQRIRENFELCKQVESKLFRKLDFGPKSLAEKVRLASFASKWKQPSETTPPMERGPKEE